jgi:tRNA synthetases class II (D, K and N)
MKGLVLIPNVVKRRWHQHILHVHYVRRLRSQLLDVLAPGIGEIIGGSQREERLDVLDARMTECGVDKEHYAWYRDLRRYGTVPRTLATSRALRTCATRSRSRGRPGMRGIEVHPFA